MKKSKIGYLRDEFLFDLFHNQLIQQAWGAERVPVCEALPGLNHFSILDDFIQPGRHLHQLALQLLA